MQGNIATCKRCFSSTFASQVKTYHSACSFARHVSGSLDVDLEYLTEEADMIIYVAVGEERRIRDE